MVKINYNLSLLISRVAFPWTISLCSTVLLSMNNSSYVYEGIISVVFQLAQVSHFKKHHRIIDGIPMSSLSLSLSEFHTVALALPLAGSLTKNSMYRDPPVNSWWACIMNEKHFCIWKLRTEFWLLKLYAILIYIIFDVHISKLYKSCHLIL